MKEIHIIGGGTISYIRPHFALFAPAYGKTAKMLYSILAFKLGSEKMKNVHLHLTKSAGGKTLETNEDISKLIDSLIEDPKPKIIFMNAALCDFDGRVVLPNGVKLESGKNLPRLNSAFPATLELTTADKIIGKIRAKRKDIFLIGFKTTTNASSEEQFDRGMKLLKTNSCNIVVANDLETRNNMILTPEMASYGNTTDRFSAMDELVDIVLARSENEFSRTELVTDSEQSETIPMSSAPEALQKVVEYCVRSGAYKPFNGKTVGHFGFKPLDQPDGVDVFISSRRKQNYNLPGATDMTKVEFYQDGTVKSYAGKPSAGVRSQYYVITNHKQFNCVVHFHCPLKDGVDFSTRIQKYFECGSHQCGQNTSEGISLFEDGKIGAVMLDKHGPNILFNENIDPDLVISFIEKYFDLTKSTR